MYKNFSFNIIKKDTSSNARLGIITTPHGDIETPSFVFCGTKAAIKSLNATQMIEANSQIMLSNTYHLMLQPGIEVIKSLGGLHKMMNWHKPLLTDSGGFQIFSLGSGSISNEIKGKRNTKSNKTLIKIDENGAIFRSYIDGSIHVLTPEKSIQVQNALGADLIVVLDECTPLNVTKKYTEDSMEMSHRWAIRSLKEFTSSNNYTQALYGIIQGGIYNDLRKRGVDFVNEQEFFGHAVGGCLGSDKKLMHDIVSYTMSMVSRERPVHLLGIGGISDIFNGVKAGIDSFDCVHPTRLARHGGALVPKFINLTDKEHININKSVYKLQDNPIDKTCKCYACQNHSVGYIHHLFKANEILGIQLLTMHNVYFMNRLFHSIRDSIKNEKLDVEEKNWV